MSEVTGEAEPRIAPHLTDALSELGREYGPLGVALAAARMTSVDALVQRLIGPSVKNTDVSSPTDKGHMGAPMTDRITLPASVIEDARAHPEKYRPEVEAGDRVLVVNGTLGSDGLIGTVMAKSVQVTGDPVIGISGGGTTHTVFGWLRVGGVEQGPRPEVSGRVLVLRWANGNVDPAVCTVTGGAERDDVHPNSIQVREDGTGVRVGDGVFGPVYYATEWALLPAEDDGMGEATAGRKPLQPGQILVTDPVDLKRLRELRRNADADVDHWREHGTKRPRERTVGSLNADDIGRWIEIDPWPGTLLRVAGRLTEAPGEVRTVDGRRLLELHLHHPTHGRLGHLWIPDTQCRVSDGPGGPT